MFQQMLKTIFSHGAEFSEASRYSPQATGMSRRTFLRASAGLAAVQDWSSLVDELTSLLGGHEELPLPDRGESLPEDYVPPSKDTNTEPSAQEKGQIFLTFDDGPLHCTGRILDLLALTRHKATFFVVGRNLTDPKLRAFAVRALKEGHDMGNHSFHHPDFSRISAKRAKQEIVATHHLIDEVIKEAEVDPKRQNLFFRFPYGVSGSWSNYSATQEVLGSLGYSIAWWDLDTNDWRMELAWFPRSPKQVLAALKRAHLHDVILLHDRQKTAANLARMVDTIDARQLLSVPLSHYNSVLQGSSQMELAGHDESPRTESSPSNREDLLSEAKDHSAKASSIPQGFTGPSPVTDFDLSLW